jgi:hypothetical protein
MLVIIVLIVTLLVIFFVGKYITASNKDKNNRSKSAFGEELANFAKNLGCIIGGVLIAVIGGGIFLVLKFLLG